MNECFSYQIKFNNDKFKKKLEKKNSKEFESILLKIKKAIDEL